MPGPGRSRRRLRPRRQAAVVAVARAVFIAVCLVTAYCLLPPDEHRTAGASALLLGGFAQSYADQDERDFTALKAAHVGRIRAERL